jgi:ribosomal protein S18 acetylase RimI-like enzyme
MEVRDERAGFTSARRLSAPPPSVWLDVLRENNRAVNFYRCHGFVVTGEHSFEIGVQQFLFTL